ncbi:hypothetical protein Scep_020844 [Stephania cephalantha]|uniref:DYW domain-containing protein n=1 Tax=Stephania cephalantha TaxID=152367 RepID=A0AAP0F4Z9_9MAGN
MLGGGINDDRDGPRNNVRQFASPNRSNALQVFDEIPESDTFAWNSLIQTHIANGDWDLPIFIYNQMLLRGVRPDKRTLPRILNASQFSGNFFYGRQLHGHALKLGFALDSYVITALMDLYGHYDGVEAAQRLLDQSHCLNSVSWTMLARLYMARNRPNSVLETFKQMVELGTVDVDAVALATAINACGQLKSIREGRRVRDVARKLGLELDVLVCNSLLKMYMDCGSISDARGVLDQMPSKDVISWTSVIHWYVRNGEFNEALKLFRVMMNSQGVKPDQVLVSGVLPACARVAAGKQGKEIHAHSIRTDVDSYQAVQNALMDMYIKSGCLDLASRIFNRMNNKDNISWTVMILGHSLHGQGKLGLELFQKMKSSGNAEFDDTLYEAVLHSCVTARQVEEGKSYFKYMKEHTVEHCCLMVSLLGHAGRFDDAKAFILEHHLERNVRAQRALLDGCRTHQNRILGKKIGEALTELEPLNADNYILLSNLYASYGKLNVANEFKEVIRDMGLRPKKAYSWIEIRNKVHVFGVGDVSHPRSVRIYHELQALMRKMKEECYVADVDFSLHDVDEERECILVGHSELLALSFGLISTQPAATIRVTKNLRMCRSCHSSAKFISKLVRREIILKDPRRFHHFKNGFCSCEDLQ